MLLVEENLKFIVSPREIHNHLEKMVLDPSSFFHHDRPSRDDNKQDHGFDVMPFYRGAKQKQF